MRAVAPRRDFAWALAAELLHKLVGYVVLLVLARHLDKGSMGELFFATAFARFFALAAELGTTRHLVRAVAQEPARAAEHLARVLALRLPLSVAVLAAQGALVALFAPSLLPVVALTATWVLVGDLYFSFGATFVGLRRLGLRLATGAIGPLALVAFVLVGVRLGFGLLQILACYVAAHLLALVAAFAALRWRVGRLHLRWRGARLAALARGSWPFFLVAVLELAYFKIDSLLLFVLASREALADYEAAYRLFEVSRMAVRPLHLVFFPLAAGYAAAASWDAFQRLATRLLRSAALGGALVSAAVVGAAGVLVPLLWGDGYRESTPVLRVLYLATAPLYAGFVASFLAYSLHLERAVLRTLAIAAVASIVLDVVAIPLAGPLGAAWTTVATEIVICARLVLLVRRALGERTAERARTASALRPSPAPSP